MTNAPVATSSRPRGKKRRRRRALRGALGALTAALVAVVGLWFAVHRIAWLGPWLADSGRKVLGDRVVSKLEDWAYGIDDAWNRLSRGGERPQPRWVVPARAIAAPAGATVPVPGAFRPLDVGPVYEKFAAVGDGAWVGVPDPRRPDDAPLLYKTLLHPDERRAWAELYVVAIDGAGARFRIVAGTVDPEATTPEGRVAPRPALVPSGDLPELVAAFNGGFKTEHGHFGMRAGGVTLIPPRDDSCTLAAYDDDTLRIATWTALAADEPRMLWWRQTPPCMFERGTLHPWLREDASKKWGAAVGGETVIRRSAIGLSEHGDVVYVGISEATTARAIALGMHHAGAWDVAELDVNWSYPKFLLFRAGEAGALEAVGLFPGFAFRSDEYVRRPAPKDFFYVLRRR
jgi:hypothetical protein